MDINNAGWYLAGIVGAGLVGVVWAVWAMSKRTIHVEQHNIQHNDPHVEAAQAGGGGPYPMLVGAIAVLLVVGLLMVGAVNLAQSVSASIERSVRPVAVATVPVATVPVATVEVKPTAVPVPTAAPAATVAPSAEPVRQPVVNPLVIVPQPERSINWMHVAIGVLAVAAIGVWGYAGFTLWTRRSIKRPNVVTPEVARQRDRESRLESILPDSVRDLER